MPRPEPAPAPELKRALVVSIVSHGHGALVERLLLQMCRLSGSGVTRVVLTQNVPELPPTTPPGGWPFALEVVRNDVPRGFGDNHNHALAGAREPFVCVLNPDVVLLEGTDPFAALVGAAAQPGVGCAYPEQVGLHGDRQDSERTLPTPMALWRRRVLRQRDASPARVDWVNAACLVLPTPAWVQVGGFDVSYFMYCEDVDLCLRLRLAGLALVRAPVRVVHAGQRASHRNWAHLRWHVRSLLRLWRSPVYRQARRLLCAPAAAAGTIGRS